MKQKVPLMLNIEERNVDHLHCTRAIMCQYSMPWPAGNRRIVINNIVVCKQCRRGSEVMWSPLSLPLSKIIITICTIILHCFLILLTNICTSIQSKLIIKVTSNYYISLYIYKWKVHIILIVVRGWTYRNRITNLQIIVTTSSMLISYTKFQPTWQSLINSRLGSFFVPRLYWRNLEGWNSDNINNVICTGLNLLLFVSNKYW